MVNSIRVAAVTGIAAAEEVEDLDADHRTAAVAAEAVATSTSRLPRMARHSSSSSRATIVGRSQNVLPDSMAARADSLPAATEATTIAASAEAAVTTAAGRRAAAQTSTTQSWAPEMSAWRWSCSAWAIRESILTNTRIYPWRRRARMCPRTSHRSMMCS